MLDHNQALAALIDHVSASALQVSISWDEVQRWQDGVLEQVLVDGLLSRDVNAQSLECVGCEHRCFMPVYQSEDRQRAFIVCDHTDMQTHMGRVNVAIERLQQWQASSKQFAVVIARLLGIDAKPTYQKSSASYRLGMLKSSGGRRWVSMATIPLTLDINQNSVPLVELIYFSEGALAIDRARIDALLNSPAGDTGKSYTPDISRREARKNATQARYQDWNDEYLSLKQKHPGKPDTWYSVRIAKLPIAQGKGSETIRKNMK